MYRTCLFCHNDLDSNEVVEQFTVGRRLAFDADRGRLWVVCPHCERWNLSPLEERWEAIETCERRFRAERLRRQTDQIGMARLREGLELIRVGRPLRPEFAAWRYGDQLGHRMRRGLMQIGGGVVAAGAVTGVAAATGLLAGAGLVFPPALVWAGGWGFALYTTARGRLRSFRVPTGAGRTLTLFGADLRETTLRPDDTGAGWVLSLRHVTGWTEISGDEARRVLGVVLPRVNRLGARTTGVRRAAELIEAQRGPERFLSAMARESKRLSADYLERRARFRRHGQTLRDAWTTDRELGTNAPVDRGALPRLPTEQRLALEMAVHEESERCAMENELRPLTAAWREAEEIAAISDRLTTPAEHERWITERRGDARMGTPRVDGE